MLHGTDAGGGRFSAWGDGSHGWQTARRSMDVRTGMRVQYLVRHLGLIQHVDHGTYTDSGEVKRNNRHI